MISVIIPTCNRVELLASCLCKLAPSVQCVQSTLYEIIVTDDSKEFATAVFIERNFSWVRYVRGTQTGPAANRNNGAKYAKGEWLVFIDDDCKPCIGLLDAYRQAIEEYKNTRVFEGYTGNDREQHHFLEESPINTTGGYLWSCNFMIDSNLFKNILKGFDEEYPYAAMEDVDLHYRLKKLHQPVQFLDKACVIHPWRLQAKPFTMSKRRFASLIYFINKFPEKRKDYNEIYFFKAFLSFSAGIFKNSIRFRFRGFLKRTLITFQQLYFAVYILIYNYNR